MNMIIMITLILIITVSHSYDIESLLVGRHRLNGENNTRTDVAYYIVR